MKNKKGISLIVLIITIVVIIILAAAVILTINKNNPVESAKKATFLNDLNSYQDELSMYIGNKYIEAKGSYEISSLDGKALEDVITVNSKYNTKFTIKDGRIIGTDKLTQEEKEWADSITGGETGSVTPPVSKAPSNYTDIDGRKAYIPTGFIVSTVANEQKIDTGLVIKDSKGNEFVWIPVEYTDDADFATKFVRKDGYSSNVLQNRLKYCTEPYSGASQSEKDEYNNMVESVKKYHGYYIARYETSNDGSGNAQSKPNTTTWINIPFATSITDLSGGVVEKSRAMHPVATASEGNAVSTLIYGVQWDVSIDFIENYGIKDKIVRKDSTGKGKYNGSKINTGSDISCALNNIYDLAGNLFELTMESSGNECVYRGGAYDDNAIIYPISYRNWGIANNISKLVGFRIALYIK